MASGGISSRTVAVGLGISIVATLDAGSAVAMRRTGTPTIEAGPSGDPAVPAPRSATTRSVDAHGVPLPTLGPDGDGESTSTTSSPSTASSTVPGPTSTVPTGSGTSPTTTTPDPEAKPSQGTGILVMRPDGSDATLVTTASGVFSWSPDGRSLAVTKAGTIVVVGADGSGENPDRNRH